jgi:hypothetical protein
MPRALERTVRVLKMAARRSTSSPLFHPRIRDEGFARLTSGSKS